MKGLESRIVRIVLAVQLCCLMVVPCFAIVQPAEGATSRSETVNVAMDADGMVESEKVETVVKKSDGTSETTEETTSEQTPITVSVRYELDGKGMLASDLAGKTGDVVIRYDYENHSRTTQEVNGKEHTVFTPFTVITALMVDEEVFSNVEVTNGKVIEDKGQSIIAGYAFPGLRESLGIESEDSDIPEYFEVRAHVEGFELKSTLTMATAGLFADMNADKLSLGDAANAPEELSKAMGLLIEGSDELGSGLDELTSGTYALKDGSEALNDGTRSLDYGIRQAAEGAAQIDAAAASLNSGLQTILKGDGTAANPGISGIQQGYAQLSQSTHSFSDQMKSIPSDSPGTMGALGGAKATLDGIIAETTDPVQLAKLQSLSQQLDGVQAAAEMETAQRTAIQKAQIDGLGTLTSSFDALNAGLAAEVSGLERAAVGASQLSEGTSELNRGMADLTGGSSQLVDASGALAQGTGQVAEGVENAAQGSKTLSDGMRSFDEEGIGALQETLVEKYGATIDKANALSKAAKEYKSFTGGQDEAESSVKFIFETKPVSPSS